MIKQYSVVFLLVITSCQSTREVHNQKTALVNNSAQETQLANQDTNLNVWVRQVYDKIKTNYSTPEICRGEDVVIMVHLGDTGIVKKTELLSTTEKSCVQPAITAIRKAEPFEIPTELTAEERSKIKSITFNFSPE